MSSCQEAITQIRELEERAMEELTEIVQQGPGCAELSGMTTQPDSDLQDCVHKAESTPAQRPKHFSAPQDVIKALRLATQWQEPVNKQAAIFGPGDNCK